MNFYVIDSNNFFVHKFLPQCGLISICLIQCILLGTCDCYSLGEQKSLLKNNLSAAVQVPRYCQVNFRFIVLDSKGCCCYVLDPSATTDL